MAKFLFCLPRFHTNAVPWVALLQEMGHEVRVHVVSKGATENYQYLSPLVLEPSSASRLWMRVAGRAATSELRRYPALRAYWRLMWEFGPDVVIVRGITRWFSRIAALCALGQRRRLVIYDQEDPVPPPWSTTAFRRATLRAFGIPHVTSRLSVKRTASNRGVAMELPFGCPFPPGALGSRQAGWPPRLLMVAKYRERKGHHALLRALSALKDDFQFCLTLCGEEASSIDTAYCQILKSAAEDLGLAGRISFRNNVAHQNMLSVYLDHDVFILPSRREPAAVSPIEAAWAGCSVLVSHDSGTRGYLPPGKAFEFDPSDPLDLARALRLHLTSPSHLEAAQTECTHHIRSVAPSHAIADLFNSMLTSTAA